MLQWICIVLIFYFYSPLFIYKTHSFFFHTHSISIKIQFKVSMQYNNSDSFMVYTSKKIYLFKSCFYLFFQFFLAVKCNTGHYLWIQIRDNHVIILIKKSFFYINRMELLLSVFCTSTHHTKYKKKTEKNV